MKKMLVVARKYNDIFYAISSEEWEKCTEHILLFITDRLDKDSYPLEDFFTCVYTIHISLDKVGIPKAIFNIKSILSKIDFDVVTTSNVVLVTNLYILSNKKVKQIILLEDGLMNYYNFKPSQEWRKMMLIYILNIKVDKIFRKIEKTYLLKPGRAKYYYGEKSQLNLKRNLFNNHLNINPILEGKSIFIGIDLYKSNRISVKQYCNLVNDIISKYKIDYYIPHNMSSFDEHVSCEIFDITKTKTTLEIYALFYNFKVYSFISSTLFTTKIINNGIGSFAINIAGLNEIPKDSIIRDLADKIYDYSIS